MRSLNDCSYAPVNLRKLKFSAIFFIDEVEAKKLETRIELLLLIKTAQLCDPVHIEHIKEMNSLERLERLLMFSK